MNELLFSIINFILLTGCGYIGLVIWHISNPDEF